MRCTYRFLQFSIIVVIVVVVVIVVDVVMCDGMFS